MAIKATDLGGWPIIDRFCVAAHQPLTRCHVGSCLHHGHRSALVSSADRSQSGVRRRCSKHSGKPTALLGSAAAFRVAALTTKPHVQITGGAAATRGHKPCPLLNLWAWSPQGLARLAVIAAPCSAIAWLRSGSLSRPTTVWLATV